LSGLSGAKAASRIRNRALLWVLPTQNLVLCRYAFSDSCGRLVGVNDWWRKSWTISCTCANQDVRGRWHALDGWKAGDGKVQSAMCTRLWIQPNQRGCMRTVLLGPIWPRMFDLQKTFDKLYPHESVDTFIFQSKTANVPGRYIVSMHHVYRVSNLDQG